MKVIKWCLILQDTHYGSTTLLLACQGLHKGPYTCVLGGSGVGVSCSCSLGCPGPSWGSSDTDTSAASDKESELRVPWWSPMSSSEPVGSVREWLRELMPLMRRADCRKAVMRSVMRSDVVEELLARLLVDSRRRSDLARIGLYSVFLMPSLIYSFIVTLIHFQNISSS